VIYGNEMQRMWPGETSDDGLAGNVSELFRGTYVCDQCSSAGADSPEQLKQIEEAAAKVVVTTTNSIDGYVVRKYLGIESVEFVLGTGFFSEIASASDDLRGLRSSGFERKLQDAKQTALTLLKVRAAGKGANAVIGVDLDYTEFSSNKSVSSSTGLSCGLSLQPPRKPRLQANRHNPSKASPPRLQKQPTAGILAIHTVLGTQGMLQHLESARCS